MVIKAVYQDIADNVRKVIKGADKSVEIILAAMLASGHILIEDYPGTGKTVLAKAIAKSVDCTFKRIQFTPDLLPSDVTGINFFNIKKQEFELRKGAVFTNILLGDEINRATPRTQSALLECMSEYQVTIDGETYKLDKPFTVIATQNPIEQYGTYPLPEAQLDRFMIKISLGYPEINSRVDILRQSKIENQIDSLLSVIRRKDFLSAMEKVRDITVNDNVLYYIASIGEKSRQIKEVELGLSVRGEIALMHLAQAYAGIQGKAFVTPQDVKTVAPFVIEHRLYIRDNYSGNKVDARGVTLEILDEVPVPTEEII